MYSTEHLWESAVHDLVMTAETFLHLIKIPAASRTLDANPTMLQNIRLKKLTIAIKQKQFVAVVPTMLAQHFTEVLPPLNRVFIASNVWSMKAHNKNTAELHGTFAEYISRREVYDGDIMFIYVRLNTIYRVPRGGKIETDLTS
jgi:hypothetical protein